MSSVRMFVAASKHISATCCYGDHRCFKSNEVRVLTMVKFMHVCQDYIVLPNGGWRGGDITQIHFGLNSPKMSTFKKLIGSGIFYLNLAVNS